MPKKSGSKYCHVNAFVVNNKNGQIFKKSFKFKVSEQLTDKERFNLMFSFIQFIERQIVLFDAIEDSSGQNLFFIQIQNLKIQFICIASMDLKKYH